MFGLFKSNKSFEEEMAELEKMSNDAKELMEIGPRWTSTSADEGMRLAKKAVKLKVNCCKRHNHSDLSLYQWQLDQMNGKYSNPFK